MFCVFDFYQSISSGRYCNEAIPLIHCKCKRAVRYISLKSAFVRCLKIKEEKKTKWNLDICCLFWANKVFEMFHLSMEINMKTSKINLKLNHRTI